MNTIHELQLSRIGGSGHPSPEETRIVDPGLSFRDLADQFNRLRRVLYIMEAQNDPEQQQFHQFPYVSSTDSNVSVADSNVSFANSNLSSDVSNVSVPNSNLSSDVSNVSVANSNLYAPYVPNSAVSVDDSNLSDTDSNLSDNIREIVPKKRKWSS